MKQKIVGILLFNEVEVLDFAGPFEVFSVTEDHSEKDKPFKVVTISQDGQMIKARNGLRVLPDYSFESHPDLDILVVPGGYGAREIELHNQDLHQWLKEQDQKTDYTTSVCTGAFLLAKAGLLENKTVTTHFSALDRLADNFPSLNVKRNTKFVDEGHILTSAGISAGIELSLYLVGKILGASTAKETAKQMEYDSQYTN
ncbi:DJ-1/PfpI family protein [Marinilactibacillus sp. Marseille-P9653]|uniref:DJ-1/PfpI family protein n=1 Tax=Marinilactibacillus sp. Marseille-P9653 TaxID=2866583 RepID=UPI001CE4978D|nr:DJ-1/PfpI family protein [Marinilactibacillus sp. Marseille-P9653]